MAETTNTTPAATPEREKLRFVHYETGEVREVVKPNKLQQYSREFIGAFITSKEHYTDLPWYRAMVNSVLDAVKAEHPDYSGGQLQITAFPKLRIEFVTKYFPEHAPKEKTHKAKKPGKIDIWGL